MITTAASIFEPTPYQAYNIFAVDDSAKTLPIGNPGGFGEFVRFRLRKRGGRVGHTYLDVLITVPETVDPANFTAAWVDDLGANLIEQVIVEYSSKHLHVYRGEQLKKYQRLMDHDITKEHYNGNQLAGLPGVNGEQLRSNASTSVGVIQVGALVAGQFRLRIALDWIWWTKEDESALATEALASDIDIQIKFRPISQLVYARAIGVPAVPVDPFAGDGVAYPTLTAPQLYHELIFTPKVEASKHLSRYENRRGLMFKILDFEEQNNNVVAKPAAGSSSIVQIPLNNFRLDSLFLFFDVRDSRINTPYGVDRGSSDNTYSNVMNGIATVTAGAVSPPVAAANVRQSGALNIIKRFRLTANGSVLMDWVEEFENRGMWRKKYFPGSQVNGAVYFAPFAKKLREYKHCFGYQNFSNLGNVVLEVDLETPAVDPNPGCTGYIIDVTNVCHNVIQMAQGDIVKALR